MKLLYTYNLSFLLFVGGFYSGCVWGADLLERDSLLEIWQNVTASDTSRLHAMEVLIQHHYIGNHPDSAKFFAQQFYDQAVQVGEPYFLAKAQQFWGDATILMGRYEEAKPHLEFCVEFNQHIHGCATSETGSHRNRPTANKTKRSLYRLLPAGCPSCRHSFHLESTYLERQAYASAEPIFLCPVRPNWDAKILYLDARVGD